MLIVSGEPGWWRPLSVVLKPTVEQEPDDGRSWNWLPARSRMKYVAPLVRPVSGAWLAAMIVCTTAAAAAVREGVSVMIERAQYTSSAVPAPLAFWMQPALLSAFPFQAWQ